MKRTARLARTATGTPDGMLQRLRVPFEYPVWFTRDIFSNANPLLARTMDRMKEGRRHRALVCVDSGLLRAIPELPARIAGYFRTHSARIELAGPVVRVRGGERAKHDLAYVKRILTAINEHHLCRHSYVILVGGGSVLDAAGFAASVAHRGLRVVRLPTTVVAQNDVGVGVKTGIDLFGVKNFMGTFAPPFAVINDFDFLRNLPRREWISGAAEAFKVALIKDVTFFRYLCLNAAALRHRDEAVMETVVRRCAALHLRHIRAGGDPFETGSARPLDFGHWSAHHLEVLSGYRILHGEAVSIGIALDSYYAWRKGLISRSALDSLLDALATCRLPVYHPVLERRKAGRLAVLDGLDRFREHLGGELTITLPHPPGRLVQTGKMEPHIIAEGIRFLRRASRRSMRQDG